MGMFDSIYLPLKCPNCGDEGEKELQTKDLRCFMDGYRVGDSIGTTQFRWLYCYAGCCSKACLAWEEAENVKRKSEGKGTSHGFGYSWDCFAEVDELGRITGKVVTESELPAAFPRTEREQVDG